MDSKQKRRRNILPVLLIVILFTVLGFFLWSRVLFIDYTPKNCRESAQELSNPYIGWYSLYGYLLSDTQELTLPRKEEYENSSPGLVLLQINLKNYADCDISSSGLHKLDELLSAWQDTKSQLILRFVYDWDGQNLSTEPKEVSQILRHMEQTGEIVSRYPESVFLIQGIFVGNWGEMHNTRYMDTENMTALLTHLASVTDPSIFLSVRTPAQLRTVLGSASPLDASRAFQGTLASRLGLFNDGILGSETDAGTYSSSSRESTDYSLAWSRTKELAFQNKLCSYVPNGGEVILESPLNDLEPAVTALSDMHVSYLNKEYDPEVLNKWKATAYAEAGSVYNGLSGYDYISRHLGYRYVLKSSALHHSSLISSSAKLSLTLENTGFASCYRPLDFCVNMVSDSGNAISLPVDADLRYLQSQTSQEFSVSLNLTDTEPGHYTFYLKINDPALDREILLANTLKHGEYGYAFASADISKTPD